MASTRRLIHRACVPVSITTQVRNASGKQVFRKSAMDCLLFLMVSAFWHAWLPHTANTLMVFWETSKPM